MKFGIGQPVRRAEDPRFLTGAGRYTDDIDVPGQVYAYVLRSPHAHAEIGAIDTRTAGAAPGVLAVLTGADVEADGLSDVPCIYRIDNADGSQNAYPPHPMLAKGRVHHVGDAVALVVAETLDQARDAAELIAIDYRPLPVAAATATAAAEGTPQIWDDAPGNICFFVEQGEREAIDAVFASAPHVVKLDLVNNRVAPNPIEPRAALALHDAAGERYTIYTCTQSSHRFRDVLANDIFQVPPEKMLVITPDVGGGFGAKIHVYQDQALALWAAKKVSRPVKWCADRSQSFISDAHGRDNVTHAELAFDDDGRFLAVRSESYANMGAYLSNVATVVQSFYGGIQTSVYAIPDAYVAVKGVFTNTVPVDAYRGAGRPEAIYRIERLIDLAAQELGLDPAEIRRRNLISPEAMPYTTALGMTYDTGEFARNLDDSLAAARWSEFPARREEARTRDRLRGIGISGYIDTCAGPYLRPEEAAIRFEKDETVTLFIGTQANGQGHETSYAQMLTDALGIDFEKIHVRQGDTSETSLGGGALGSRSMVIGGLAVNAAVETVIDKAKPTAAELLEAAATDIEFAEGQFIVTGTDRGVGIFDVAAVAREGHGGIGASPLEGRAQASSEASTYPNGFHVCEVEIDPETGALEVVAFTAVDDFGTVINPLLAAGQVYGGIAQGIGQALLENAVYDEETGQLLTGSFMDYAMPRASDLPMMDVSWNEIPCRTNPLGVKGAGEAGSIGAPPAVINAIVNALAEYGITHIDMPATPERVWSAIHAARGI